MPKHTYLISGYDKNTNNPATKRVQGDSEEEAIANSGLIAERVEQVVSPGAGPPSSTSTVVLLSILAGIFGLGMVGAIVLILVGEDERQVSQNVEPQPEPQSEPEPEQDPPAVLSKEEERALALSIAFLGADKRSYQSMRDFGPFVVSARATNDVPEGFTTTLKTDFSGLLRQVDIPLTYDKAQYRIKVEVAFLKAGNPAWFMYMVKLEVLSTAYRRTDSRGITWQPAVYYDDYLFGYSGEVAVEDQVNKAIKTLVNRFAEQWHRDNPDKSE